MQHPHILSYRYNMSWGFIPAILSMLLFSWKATEVSIYIGNLAGILACLFIQARKKVGIPHFYLYSTTGMLTLFSFFSLIAQEPDIPQVCLTLEIITVIPPAFLYVNRTRVAAFGQKYSKTNKKLFNQGLEASLVSSKIILILSSLHFLTISCIALFEHSMPPTWAYILFQITPPAVLTAGIIFNHLAIFLFNRLYQQASGF